MTTSTIQLALRLARLLDATVGALAPVPLLQPAPAAGRRLRRA